MRLQQHCQQQQNTKTKYILIDGHQKKKTYSSPQLRGVTRTHFQQKKGTHFTNFFPSTKVPIFLFLPYERVPFILIILCSLLIVSVCDLILTHHYDEIASAVHINKNVLNYLPIILSTLISRGPYTTTKYIKRLLIYTNLMLQKPSWEEINRFQIEK